MKNCEAIRKTKTEILEIIAIKCDILKDGKK
jgi:hypothetical protein